jgi:hypothetical protein
LIPAICLGEENVGRRKQIGEAEVSHCRPRERIQERPLQERLVQEPWHPASLRCRRQTW